MSPYHSRSILSITFMCKYSNLIKDKKHIFWNKVDLKFIFFKFNKSIHVKNLLQVSYLVQFRDFVRKSRWAISAGGVVIHKHNSITIRKETPRFP